MAHFAEIDKNGIVIRVLVTDNSSPNEGKDWLESRLGGTWVQTSYNTRGGEHLLGGTPLRKNFAAVGGKYDSKLDAFIPPKPYKSWILNKETCLWEAPISKPEDEKLYGWDENSANWIEVIEEIE